MKNKIKLIVSLLKLVRPFLTFMLLAIILGVLGHLTATFITIFIILAFCKVITFSLAVKLLFFVLFQEEFLDILNKHATTILPLKYWLTFVI